MPLYIVYATCTCTYVYTAFKVNLIVLFRGTDCSRTATAFPIWCRSKPRVEATKQLAIRLSALSIRSPGDIHGGAKGFGPGEIRTHMHISSFGTLHSDASITITVSRWTAAHSFRRWENRYVYPTVPKKPFGYIDRIDVENVSNSLEILYVSLIYPRLGFLLQDAISFVKITILA